MKSQIALFILGLASVTFAATPKISPSIWECLLKEEAVNIIISFKENDLESVRHAAKAQPFSTRTQRIQALHDALKSYADSAQASVLTALESSKLRKSSIKIRQLWITNQIAVRGADQKLLQELIRFPEIQSIEEDESIPVHRPDVETAVPKTQLQEGEQWGVIAVEAPAVWETGVRGAGAVVAVVDTGVRGTHEALKDSYRALNGWYDPTEFSSSPNDAIGHGTHLAGTIAGRVNGIGVAPESKWIACKGCSTSSCQVSDLISCGQWALCPTDSEGATPRCDLAPSVVTNGWGGGGSGDNFYENVLEALDDAGIVSLFATGNSGPNLCGSISSPADSARSLTVASLSAQNRVSTGSAGPAGNRIKPDISAPGVNIISAGSISDDSYVAYSGSSMAAPHVSGVIALLKSKKPDASLEQIKEALYKGAQPTVPTGTNCGGIDESTYPNNHAGHGGVSARASAALLS